MDAVADLSDAVMCTVIIEERPLIAREVSVTSLLVSNETVGGGRNFKKFRKIPHLSKRILPLIIGGNDLHPHTSTTLEIGVLNNHRPTEALNGDGSEDDVDSNADPDTNNWDFHAN